MIKRFKHRGLKKLFDSGVVSGIQPQYSKRLHRILALLETADSINDMDLPGLELHELKGNRTGTYAVKVSAHWRVTFHISEGDVFEVDYEDYH